MTQPGQINVLQSLGNVPAVSHLTLFMQKMQIQVDFRRPFNARNSSTAQTCQRWTLGFFLVSNGDENSSGVKHVTKMWNIQTLGIIILRWRKRKRFKSLPDQRHRRHRDLLDIEMEMYFLLWRPTYDKIMETFTSL